ncbi:MAG: hypothetical protein AAB924_00260, partial [Patescibacteria group bacterium]
NYMSKKIFFGMIVIFLAGSVYYGLKSPNTNDAGVTAVESLSANSNTGIADEGDKIIKIISTLNTIKLNTSFFQEEAFLSLKDLSVHLVEGSMGKSNPFANY